VSEPSECEHRSRRRRWTAAVIWATSASLLGTSAVATSATAADTNTPEVAIRVDNDAQAERRQPGAAATAAPVPVHGVAEDGTVFDGTFELRRFDDRRGVLYAVGRLEGQLGERAVHKKNVRLPVNGATNELPAEGIMQPHGFMAAPQQVPTPGACDILTLNLGPLDLDILGLRVALDEVNLLIEAIPGAGNLLGNLLCAVAGLLNGGGLGGLLSNLLGAITDLLNGLLGL
jgi:hypothetical protein